MIICVTGPMAAGKNLASSILEEKGLASVDADELAHRAVENARDKIIKEFGSLAKEKGISLLNKDGTLNRRQLGALIFSDKALVKKQEDIVYPEINSLFDEFIQSHQGQDVIINATVLYKVPLIKKVDCIIYIDAPVLQRLFRASRRDHIPLRQIRQRFRQQRHLFSKYSSQNADIYRVWNTGTRRSLEKKLMSVLGRI